MRTAEAEPAFSMTLIAAPFMFALDSPYRTSLNCPLPSLVWLGVGVGVGVGVRVWVGVPRGRG